MDNQLLKNPLKIMWTAYKKYVRGVLMPNNNDALKDISYWRNELFCNISIYIIPITFIALVPGVYMSILNGISFLAIFDLVVFTVLVVIAVNRRLTLWARKFIFISCLYFLAIALLYYLSEFGPGMQYLLALSVITTVIFSIEAAYYSVLANLIICVIFGLLIHFGFNSTFFNNYTVGSWIAVSSNLIVLSLICVVCLNLLIKGLESTIVERKNAGEILRNNEVKMKQAQAIAHLGSWEHDFATNIGTWSEEACRIHGLLPEENKQSFESWLSFIHPEDLEYVKKEIEKSSASLSDSILNFRIMRKDGTVRYIYSISKFVLNYEGKPIGIYGITHDITERKIAEEEVKKLNEELEQKVIDRTAQLQKSLNGISDYKYALDASSIVSITNSKGIIKYVNDNFCNISKYNREELIGQDHRIINSGYHPKEFIRDLWVTITNSKIWRGEVKNKAKDGFIFWLETTIVPFLDEEGKPYQYIAIRSDITERKNAEEKLLIVSRRLSLAVRAGRIGIWELDIINNKLVWDDIMFRLYGITEQTFSGAYEVWINGLHPEDIERCNDEIRAAIAGEKEFNTEFRIIWSDSSVHYIRGIADVERDDGGNAVRMIGTNWDITESKQIQKQLIKVNAELEAFSYSVSHDLKAPLRAIIGFTSMLEEDYSSILDKEAKRITNVIKTNTTKMGSLIDALLAFSRLGRQSVSKTNINNNSLVKEIIDELVLANNEKNIDWVIASLPDSKGDNNLIHQVWTNLISNAVKYSGKKEQQRIEIGSFKKDGQHVFFVRDNGAGFDEQYSNKLFKVFQRLHSADEFEGTGIGLAIVEKIISKHGGNVWAEGEVDKGACFYFSMPIK